MIAQEQKFDLILRVEAPLLEEQDPETVTQRINNRVVLYSHENVDITPLVILRLNAEWAKTKAGGLVSREWECPVCKKKNRSGTCTATTGCPGRKPWERPPPPTPKSPKGPAPAAWLPGYPDQPFALARPGCERGRRAGEGPSRLV
jgi:hypothetical protein